MNIPFVNSGEKPELSAKNNCDHLVLLSVATYDSMLDIDAADTAISKAEAELTAGGQLYDAKQALYALRRKHFG